MSPFYYTFKAYLTLMHESLFIRHRYTFGLENLPPADRKCFVVCNHQNTVNDPLNIMFAMPFGYKIGAMARADVFAVNKAFTAFLHWLGLVPAFRFGWEGGNALEHNTGSFDNVVERVNEGRRFLIFPEAGHTQGHYIDRFTTGTVRLAFHVAECNEWKEDIMILPAASHYEDYFRIRCDFILRFAKPISLQPYYERFREKPNSVMREITHKLHDTIQDMMLDEGIEDYEVKDFLRLSALNPGTMQDIPFPEHLAQDKSFIAALRGNTKYDDVITTARILMERERRCKVDDVTVQRNRGLFSLLFPILMMIVLFPLWIATLLPHAICYALPPRFIREDRMFINSYRYVMSVLGLYPFFAISSMVIGGILGYWWQTMLWILLWIPMATFCWHYYRFCKKTITALRWRFTPHDMKDEISMLRQKIRTLLTP